MYEYVFVFFSIEAFFLNQISTTNSIFKVFFKYIATHDECGNLKYISLPRFTLFAFHPVSHITAIKPQPSSFHKEKMITDVLHPSGIPWER